MENLSELYTEFNEKYEASVDSLDSLVEAVKVNKDVASKYKVVRGNEFFKINLETRAITVPAAYKANGLGVVGDDAADIAYFKVDRYYGQKDLSECDIVVAWQIGKNDIKYSAAYNVEVGEDSIVFGWIIDNRIVASAGAVKFSVRFFKPHTDSTTPDLLFSLNTKEATCNVQASVQHDVAAMAAIDMEKLKKENELALGLSHEHGESEVIDESQQEEEKEEKTSAEESTPAIEGDA